MGTGIAVAPEADGQSAPVRRSASTPDLGQLCGTNERTDAAEAVLLRTYTSPALENALRSDKAFWKFLTDPSTPYLDRITAAKRGDSILSPEDLPLLSNAMVEIETVPKGVDPPPCSDMAAIGQLPREQTTRMVLGHEIQLPTKNIALPITAEERDHSPWLWQMERALAIIFTKTNLYYGGPAGLALLPGRFSGA